MKKVLSAVFLSSLFLAVPVVGLALQGPGGTGIPTTISTATDIIAIIDNAANWLFVILLSVALLFILIAAFQFLTSGGDPARVTSARSSLMYALIGLGVAFLARGLVFLVKFVLGIT